MVFSWDPLIMRRMAVLWAGPGLGVPQSGYMGVVTTHVSSAIADASVDSADSPLGAAPALFVVAH